MIEYYEQLLQEEQEADYRNNPDAFSSDIYIRTKI